MLKSIIHKGKRGQVLSYDAIGGVVIFMIAVGILVVYWSSLNSSFDDNDALLVLEANTALDNLMSPRILLESDNYHINISKMNKCDFSKDEAGIYHNYTLNVIDSKNQNIKTCETKPKPTQPVKSAIAERLAYYNKEPVKVVLEIYTQ